MFHQLYFRALHESKMTDMSHEKLKEMIQKKMNNFLIIDVREDDFQIGKIKGSINYPAYEFKSKAENLKNKMLKENKQDVIFHCHFSQVRLKLYLFIKEDQDVLKYFKNLLEMKISMFLCFKEDGVNLRVITKEQNLLK